MILGAILRMLLTIKNRDRIPRLPRGMLSTEYTTISRDDARVLARLGARSPSGVQIALKRAGATSVNELVQQLQHHRPRRNIRQRWSRALDRLLRASDKHPYRADVLSDARHARRRAARSEVEQRLKDRIKKEAGISGSN